MSNPREFVSLVGFLRAILMPQHLGFADPQELGRALIAWRYRLLPEEVRLLQQIAEGFKNKEIAEKMGVAEEKTIKSRIQRLYIKLHATSRVQATALAVQFELVAAKVAAPRAE